MIVPIILAGGTGSRLWPLSRERYPKQLLTLVGENSLLQETIKRTQDIPNVADPIVICNKKYRFIVAEQMLEMGIETPHLILEPVGRNTAPAIALAALIAESLYADQNPVLLILPSDHLIPEKDKFMAGIEEALPYTKDHLITFGIKPTYAETGYGYIKAGANLTGHLYQVAKFVEKPKQDIADEYIKNGSYYWNSGMFLFPARTYLQELETHRPEIYQACLDENMRIKKSEGFFTLSNKFEACPSESIDYAVMEHTDKALVIPLEVTWSDVGSWTALHEVLPQDENGNILQGDITCIDTVNCFVRAENRLVATVGLKDHIVIETKDAVMVAHKDYAQKVKDIVAQLKIQQRKDLT